MREIKFRAWSLEHNTMWHDIHKTTYFEQFLSNDKRIVMQYTGLKDKNGKEIHEGDIVVDHSDVDDKRRYQIIWENAGFEMQTKYLMRMLRIGDFLEVIGNIYENPELLGSKHNANS